VRARVERCGAAPCGTGILRVTLASASGVTAELLSWGATLARLLVPDRHGVPGDVVLGFDGLAGFLGPHPHLGGTIGRYANRIAQARFPLAGRIHRLTPNEPPHHLHGGSPGFDRRPWSAEPFEAGDEAGVVFRLTSEDDDQGYPGRLAAEARYALADSGELRVELAATAEAPTIVSLTQHAWFNLADGGAGDVLEHELEIAAGAYLPVDRERIPTGEIASVAGTPLDFRRPRTLGSALAAAPAGLDHNLVLDARGAFAFAARLRDPASGRTLELATSAPGLQLYTGNALDGTLRGRGGVAYRRHAGVCLEPQRFPDAPNRPEFGSAVLEPGGRYCERTRYRWLSGAVGRGKG
jgi:aldose 1-epimerase